jgi:peptide/nickel transport system permease protein
MALVILRLLGWRLLVAIPTVLAVSLLVFIVLRLIPTDPAAMSLPPGATAEDLDRLRTEMGLDLPIASQYLIWLGDLATGQFGTSIFFRRPVADLVAAALPNTLELVISGLVLGVSFGMALGMVLFALRGGMAAQMLDLAGSAIMAIPEFLWGLLLIIVLGVSIPLLPFFGRLDPGLATPDRITGFLMLDAVLTGNIQVLGSALRHMALPAMALAMGLVPLVMRVLRASLLDVAQEDYIRMARLRGLSESRILLRHALRNAVLPTVSLIGVQAGFMFGGTLLIEVIFGYPGLGNLMVDAVRNQDLPVIQTVALVYCVLVLALNAAVEVLYLTINPRLRST